MSNPSDRLTAALADRYTVERELGTGGMATVYLAQDIKHDRKVAVKVLRPELAAVLGADRFVREIKTTASLQHPHILPLFDSGRTGGQADGRTDEFLYYVMPYIEGETLRDKLNRETQLGIEEAVRITTEVADALDYAHRHGVIHRDIKPENILLHDGRPMVADFGIALAVSAAAGGRMTETGMSLGTPHYMSPEQATGERDITARSDVYSLGSVLYEMLTGQPPHVGGSAQQIIMRIVADDARSVTELRKSVPPHVAAAVAHALEKLPADRFASASRFAEALTNPSFTVPTLTKSTGAASQTAGLWNRLSVITTVLAVGATLVAVWGWQRPPSLQPVTQVSVRIPENEAFSAAGTFDISIDGSVMVYEGGADASVSQLWVRRWDELRARPLPGTELATEPAISPDGQEVAFSDRGSSIRVVSIQGGVPRNIGTGAVSCCVRWSTDGAWLYFLDREAGIGRIPSAGGPVETITEVGSQLGRRGHFFADPLPGGTAVLFEALMPTNSTIMAVEVETGQITEITIGGFPRYANGYLLFTAINSRTLMAAPFDVDKLELTGAARPVTDSLLPAINDWQFYAASQSGTLVYRTGTSNIANHEVVLVTREGQATTVDPDFTFNPGSNNRGLSVSPDGTRLAVTIFDNGNYDIWVKQLPRGPLQRLTFHEEWDVRPRWTPDREAVAFLSQREGRAAVFVMPVSGTGTANRLMRHEESIWEVVFSPDGEWVVGRTGGTSTNPGGRDIWGLNLSTDTVPVPLVVSPFDEKAIALSPDGHWLAYESDETGSGRYEIYVRPFPDTEADKWTVSTNGGVMPMWARSGRELFFINADNEMIAAEVQTEPTFAVTNRTTLFTIPPDILFRQVEQYALYDVMPDDQRFVMMRSLNTGADNIELIKIDNWVQDIETRAGN